MPVEEDSAVPVGALELEEDVVFAPMLRGGKGFRIPVDPAREVSGVPAVAAVGITFLMDIASCGPAIGPATVPGSLSRLKYQSLNGRRITDSPGC